MPVQYESVLAEHRSVRASMGVFDVTHLGRFELTGPGAHAAIRRLLCNDIDRIEPGRCQYSMILNPRGGIVDDLIVWWWEGDRFWVMPNATNQERVMAAFDAEEGCETDDLQSSTVFIAVQGPGAPDALEEVLGTRPPRFRCGTAQWQSTEVSIAGTGYTGEAGAEICVPPTEASSLFDAFIAAGAVPCGLGSRDTLRLESGLALWGEDIDETTTPLEAGLGFAVSMDHEFVGREALAVQLADGLEKRLSGFVLDDRGIPRHGHSVASESGSKGEVTSGNISPILETGIGMAYMSPPVDPGEPVEVEIRAKPVPGRIVDPPFHKS